MRGGEGQCGAVGAVRLFCILYSVGVVRMTRGMMELANTRVTIELVANREAETRWESTKHQGDVKFDVAKEGGRRSSG